MSGLTEAQVLCISVRKEFRERQSDRQEVNLLPKDSWEGYKCSGKKALPGEPSEKAGLFGEIYTLWTECSHLRKQEALCGGLPVKG